MNLIEYSKHCGRSKQTVHSWTVPGGLIERATKRKDGHVIIDEELADVLIQENLNLSKSKRTAEGMVPNRVTFQDALIQDKIYAATLKKIKIDREEGIQVLKADEEKEAFECGRQLRDSILSIRDRLSSILAAETDEFKIYKILTKELNQALELTISELGQNEKELKNE